MITVAGRIRLIHELNADNVGKRGIMRSCEVVKMSEERRQDIRSMMQVLALEERNRRRRRPGMSICILFPWSSVQV